jgi:hypothetical protein
MAFKEQQGRWFELSDGNSNGAADQLAVRDMQSLITHLPSAAREQLLEQFLVTISGQITGTCHQDDPRTKPGEPRRSDDPIVPLMQANVLNAASFLGRTGLMTQYHIERFWV